MQGCFTTSFQVYIVYEQIHHLLFTSIMEGNGIGIYKEIETCKFSVMLVVQSLWENHSKIYYFYVIFINTIIFCLKTVFINAFDLFQIVIFKRHIILLSACLCVISQFLLTREFFIKA